MTSIFKTSLLASSVLGFIMAGSAFAQNDAPGAPQTQPPQQQAEQQEQRQMRSQQQAEKQKPHKNKQAKMMSKHTFKGKVLQKKNVDIRGTDRKNLVVLLQTEDNRRTVVDLGDVSAMKNAKIDEGTEVTVTGTPVRIGDRLVIAASNIEVQGQQVSVQRPDMSQAERQPAGVEDSDQKQKQQRQPQGVEQERQDKEQQRMPEEGL